MPSRRGSTTAAGPGGRGCAQDRPRPADCRGTVPRVALTLLAVLAMAASVLYASHAQRGTAELHAHETAVASRVLSNMNRSDGALTAYAVTGREEAFEDFRTGTIRVRRALAAAAAAADDDPQESAAVADQRRLFARWSDLSTARSPRRRPPAAAHLRDARLARHGLLDDSWSARTSACRPVRPPGGRRGPPRVLGPAALILALSLASRRRRDGRPAAGHGRRAPRHREAQLQGRFGEGDPGLRQPGGGAPTAEDRTRAHDPRLDHHRAEPQQQRGPPRGEHADHRGLAARRGSRGGPPAVLHGGAAEPLVQPGRGGRRGPVVRFLRRVGVRHTCQPLLVGGEVIGAGSSSTAPSLADDDRGRSPTRSPRPPRRWPTCATSRSPRRAPPPMR